MFSPVKFGVAVTVPVVAMILMNTSAFRLKSRTDHEFFPASAGSGVPGAAFEHFKRANKLYEQYDLEAAIAEYDLALDLAPHFEDALLNRASAHVDAGNARQSVKDATRYLAYQEHDPEGHCVRGFALTDLGRFREALDDFNRAIELAPNEAYCYFARGYVWEKTGNGERAVADLRRSINLAPECPEGYNGLAWLLATASDEKIRDGRKAVVYAARAVRLTGGKDWIILDTLAAAFAEAGKFDKARKAQRLAMKYAPERERADLQSRLDLYLKDEPFRETVLLVTYDELTKEAGTPNSP